MSALHFTSKVWEQGNSKIVTVPREIVNQFNLKKDDMLDITAQIITKKEMEQREKLRRLQSRYPFIASATLLHENEEVATLSLVLFSPEKSISAAVESPGFNLESLPLKKVVFGIIMEGIFTKNALTKKHYGDMLLQDAQTRQHLSWTETMKLTAQNGNTYKLENLRFDTALLKEGEGLKIKEVKFFGDIKK